MSFGSCLISAWTDHKESLNHEVLVGSDYRALSKLLWGCFLGELVLSSGRKKGQLQLQSVEKEVIRSIVLAGGKPNLDLQDIFHSASWRPVNVRKWRGLLIKRREIKNRSLSICADPHVLKLTKTSVGSTVTAKWEGKAIAGFYLEVSLLLFTADILGAGHLVLSCSSVPQQWNNKFSMT